MATTNETEKSSERCPVCGEPLPEAGRDRFVSYRGAVVCSGECAQRADDRIEG